MERRVERINQIPPVVWMDCVNPYVSSDMKIYPAGSEEMIRRYPLVPREMWMMNENHHLSIPVRRELRKVLRLARACLRYSDVDRPPRAVYEYLEKAERRIEEAVNSLSPPYGEWETGGRPNWLYQPSALVPRHPQESDVAEAIRVLTEIWRDSMSILRTVHEFCLTGDQGWLVYIGRIRPDDGISGAHTYDGVRRHVRATARLLSDATQAWTAILRNEYMIRCGLTFVGRKRARE